jgi:hypothetical protein
MCASRARISLSRLRTSMASSCGRPLRRGRNREELLHLARAADADTVATEIRVPLRYVLATVCITLVSIIWYAAWSTVGAGPAAVAYLGHAARRGGLLPRYHDAAGHSRSGGRLRGGRVPRRDVGDGTGAARGDQQGYHLARPMTATETTRPLVAQRDLAAAA